MKIEAYIEKRHGRQIQKGDVILFDTWGLMAIFEKYEGGKTKLKNYQVQSMEPTYNTYDLLSDLRLRWNLMFCYAPVTDVELRENSVAGLPEKKARDYPDLFLKRTLASSALSELYKFTKTIDLPQLPPKEKRKRFAVLDPALTFLESYGEKNDSAIISELVNSKIDWLVSGDPHMLSKEVTAPLKRLGVSVINPKELDGVIASEINAFSDADKANSVDSNKPNKSYVAQAPDYALWGYWILLASIGLSFAFRAVNQTLALSFLLFIPALIGFFAIFFLLPIRLLTFIVTEIALRAYLFHIPQNLPKETVVVVGKREFGNPSFWLSPNYDVDLPLLVHYLRLSGKQFSVYYNVDLKILDEIMKNSYIRTIYLVGHGRRHGFKLDSKLVVDYCRYNKPEYKDKKDFVYQVHCNNGGGTSLVDYVVPERNQTVCLPEHGLMSNQTIYQMFIDKIIQLKHLTGIRAQLENFKYGVITSLIPITIAAVWLIIFFKVIL